MDVPDTVPADEPLIAIFIFKLLLFVGVLIVCFTVDHIRSRKHAGLDKIPGPWLARRTKLYMVYMQYKQKRPWSDMALHQKFGPIVRIAPYEVMVSSPASFRKIYGFGSDFRKGEWYQGLGDAAYRGPKMFNLMIEKDVDKYKMQRRLISPAYTPAAMKQIEGVMDNVINEQMEVLSDRAGSVVDVEFLFNKLITDCISQVTFARHNNLLQSDRDDGSIQYTLRLWNYMYISGYFPWPHFLLISFRHFLKSTTEYLFPHYAPSKGLRSKVTHSSHPWAFLKSQISRRLEMNIQQSDQEVGPMDIMARLLRVQRQKPALLNEWVASMCASNFAAGVETTSITITALIYQVLAHPGCQAKIQAEIDQAIALRRMSPPLKLSDLKELTYLNACLSESMRLHHVLGMPLPRIVPANGMMVGEHFLPAGTTVSMNPWVLNRNKTLYGKDADEWRPERWLEFSAEQLRYLSPYNFNFGSGPRSCPGKHLAEALYSKIIPLIFLHFEWELIDPGSPPRILSTVTVRYHGLMGRWKRRDQTSRLYREEVIVSV